jgi:hypothetical protein
MGGDIMFPRFMFFLKKIVAEVPEDVAVCEFECNKTECVERDWRHCERRMGKHTALMQDKEKRAGG